MPCGIHEHGVTSLADLGIHIPMSRADDALGQAFESVFGQDFANWGSTLALDFQRTCRASWGMTRNARSAAGDAKVWKAISISCS